MIKRIFVEKKAGFNTEAQELAQTFQRILGIKGLSSIRIIYRYDVEGLEGELLENVKRTIFSEPNVDNIYEDTMAFGPEEQVFATSYLPGQYDQHADSAAQCIQILAGEKPLIKVAKVVAVKGDVSTEELGKIKQYMINPVDSQETDLGPRDTLTDKIKQPADIER